MDLLPARRIGKKDQRVWEEEEEEEEVVVEEAIIPQGGSKGVDRLREYYDEAKIKLKNYLGREDAMGTGSSTPRGIGLGGGVEGGVGGTVFQQRPPHCRLEGRTEVGGGEFTDISYSDLGFIITPNPKKLTINNNYKTSVDGSSSNSTSSSNSSSSSSSSNSSNFPSNVSLPNSPTPTPSDAGYMDNHDCDPVSSEVESGNTSSTSTSSSTTPSTTTSTTSTTPPALLLHDSTSSFPHPLPGAPSPTCGSPKLLDDLKVEEITS